ncbi:MAG: S1C family serine protease [Lachnospiraceae bacterium]
MSEEYKNDTNPTPSDLGAEQSVEDAAEQAVSEGTDYVPNYVTSFAETTEAAPDEAAQEPVMQETAAAGAFEAETEASGQDTQQYAHYTVESPTSGAAQHTAQTAKRKKEKKSQGGLGRKFGVTVSLALVFGLVAGLVFQGVNAVGNQLNGTTSSAVTTTIPTTETTEATQDSVTAVSSETSSVASVAANAMPAVVAITSVSVQEVTDMFGGTSEAEGTASGSGIIVGQNDTELLIATNYHVIEDSNSLSVFFYGSDVLATSDESDTQSVNTEDAVTAQVKGTSEEDDLAVIAVKIADIPEETLSQIKVIEMGDSDALTVGEQVVAIGNALGYGQSVTSGYVSALNRQIDVENLSSTLIQTDAAINPGNSGGALLNMQGQLIGINAAKFASSSVEGIGYAIPVSVAEPILAELMTQATKELVDSADIGYIGIQTKDVSSDITEVYNIPTGVFVAAVIEGSPAEEAGILQGDVITSIAGTSISSYTELQKQMQYLAAGTEVEIVVQRSESGTYQEKTITVTLGTQEEANSATQNNTTQE